MVKKNPARHHHYLPQCYLRGFTKGGGKKSKLVVVEGPERKIFETTPRNVGGVRDFNTIKVEGVEPDVLEGELAKFESKAAYSIKQIEENPQIFFDDNDHYENIINLIALIATRNPTTRSQFEKFHIDIIEKIQSMTYASKERYEASINKMKEDSYELDESLTYEDMKKFVESKQYKISIANEWHIGLELKMIGSLLPFLYGRNWRLFVASADTGVFVTCDYPVVLVWKEPDKIPPFYRNSPGFGMKNTEVTFPLTKKIALVGDFENEPGIFAPPELLIAAMNTKTIAYSRRQVYSPKKNFYFANGAGELQDGKLLLGKYYKGLC